MRPKSNNLPISSALASETDTTPVPQWYTHTYNRPFAYRLVAAGAPCIPRPVRLSLARAMAPLFQYIMSKEYQAVRNNLRRILSGRADAAIARATKVLFQNFAVVFTDLLSLNRQTESTQQCYVHTVPGVEHLHRVLSSPRGFIVATAHMGNWELASRLLVSFGRPLYILMAPEQHAAVQRLLRQGNHPDGLHLVTPAHGGSFVQLLMALRRGAIVAIQADRATGHRRDTAAPFFGTPALFPGGLFTLAAAAQAPILPCFCLLRPDDRYDIFIEQSIAVARGQEETALHEMVRMLERFIRMAPDQWFNFYDFWNTQAMRR